MPRTRTINGPMRTGSFYDSLLNQTRSFTTGPTYRFDCYDEVGYPVPHALNIQKQWNTVFPIQGSNARMPQGTNGEIVPQYLSGMHAVNHLTPGAYYPAETLARSNPGRPVIDLPVFIRELGDVPKLLQLAGRNILSQGAKGGLGLNPNLFKGRSPAQLLASGNLNWQFGWAPLFSDLLKLTGFMDHVAKRQLELQKLYSGNGLRRRVSFPSLNVKGSIGNTTLNTDAYALDGTAEVETTVKMWGTVTWRPTSIPAVDDPSHYSAAVKATLGWDITPSTIWEALPWSWLIDWFSNVGTILMANRNTIPATPGPVCSMRYQKTTQRWKTRAISSGLTWQGAVVVKESKYRTVTTNLTLASAIPYLGLSKLSILGSLAVLNSSGWRQRR